MFEALKGVGLKKLDIRKTAIGQAAKLVEALAKDTALRGSLVVLINEGNQMHRRVYMAGVLEALPTVRY